MLKITALLFLIVWIPLNATDARKYDVLWFGDLHYDEAKYHDASKYKYTPHQLKNFRHYTKIWEQYSPPMLKTAKEMFADKVPFVIHTGDWIQGDSSSETEKVAHMQKAIEVICAGIKVPFYPVRGNHDARGAGGMPGYTRVIYPFINRQLKKEVNSLNYRMEYGKDLYLFIDSIDVDYGWLEKNLADHTKYRWTFVVAHYPLIPPPTTTRWKFGGKPENAKRLFELFLKHNVILLCGDDHKFELVQYKRGNQFFTQVMTNSVMPAKWKASEFTGKDIAKRIFQKEPEKNFLLKDALSYQGWTGGGFAVLHVDEDQVSVDFYARKGWEQPKHKAVVRMKQTGAPEK